MTENEAEALFLRKLNECVANCRLSNGFGERLRISARRMRRRGMMKLVLGVLSVVVVILAVVGFKGERQASSRSESVLLAAETPHSDTNLTNLAFLGFFRECFKRTKSNRRKEEEQ